jgi:hypothetical protein
MRNITIALFALVLVSCSETKMLQKSLRTFNSPISYLHDSPTSSCPRNKQVLINIQNTPLDTVTTVSKLRGLVLPFIFFNYFETNLKVKLGQSSIQENYTNFLKGSLTEESQRSGCFSVINQITNDSTYTLDLNIDTCNTVSQYKRTYMFMYLVFAYSWSWSESGSPAETNLQVSAKFRKGNTLVYEKKYAIKRTQPFINTNRMNANKLRADFTTNMVEGLSLSTKECTEQIVADINTSLYGSARPIIQVDDSIKTSNSVPEVIPVQVKEEQVAVAEKTVPKIESAKDQFKVGDKVKFYYYGFNDYMKGVVKEIKAKTILVEYESFGKMKTQEVNKSDIKK